MNLILILGPMKSGKSTDLINYFISLRNSKESFALFQSILNVRDENIYSRNGLEMAAQKIHSLKEILEQDHTAIGIDEIHMFPESDADAVKQMLARGIKVIVAGLDTDYRGKMFDVIKKLLEFGPNEVRYKRTVCENCQQPNAVNTQVLRNGKVMTSGLPESIPEDGTYEYKSVCRDCFVS